MTFGQDTEVAFPGSDAMLIAYQAQPRQASGPLPMVLVCRENRRLVEHIRDVAQRLAKYGGYLAVALDLFSRAGGLDNVADSARTHTALRGGFEPPCERLSGCGDYYCS